MSKVKQVPPPPLFIGFARSLFNKSPRVHAYQMEWHGAHFPWTRVPSWDLRCLCGAGAILGMDVDEFLREAESEMARHANATCAQCLRAMQKRFPA